MNTIKIDTAKLVGFASANSELGNAMHAVDKIGKTMRAQPKIGKAMHAVSKGVRPQT